MEKNNANICRLALLKKKNVTNYKRYNNGNLMD